MSSYLSKSKLLSFLQCPRRLYLEVNQPEPAEKSATAQAVMAMGNKVGEVARALYPHGVLIESQDNLSEAIRQTERHLSAEPRRPIFEATFQHEGTLVRTDLLLPTRLKWNLVEVKSSTSIKDYHLSDVAIQRFVLENAGVSVGTVSLQVINKEFVYPGNGIYHQIKKNGETNNLFLKEDVTKKIEPLVRKEVPAWIEAARKTLSKRKMPAATGNCTDPFECPFNEYCHRDGPEYPIERLPHIGKKAESLRDKGYLDICDIPEGVLKNEQQERVRRITVSGKAEMVPATALRKLGYPRYYLDFETINFGVPIWKGIRPYQHVSFQWSCHVEQKDGSLEHLEFLDLSGDNPSQGFAEQLIRSVGKHGPVIVYNKAFEGSILQELARRYKDLSSALMGIRDRIVDLLPITRNSYYHPDMRGSWSIKAVLPTIAPDMDYSLLKVVQDGSQAQQAFIEAIAPATSAERRNALRNRLLVYCGRDTEAMVRLARFLQGGKKEKRLRKRSA